MPGPYPPTDPREWIERAKSGLLLAENAAPGVLYEDLCYNAQQAAEKAIKAVFIARGLVFPYTHDIQQLVDALRQHGIVVPADVFAAKDLTRFALATRYPFAGPRLDEATYQASLRQARAAVQWAEAEVQQHWQPPDNDD